MTINYEEIMLLIKNDNLFAKEEMVWFFYLTILIFIIYEIQKDKIIVIYDTSNLLNIFMKI
jgi:hypothetical protein